MLGLGAWHLYPDICAIGEKTTIIRQKDILVKEGGLVTVGLCKARKDDSTGILWSMPLAHLRYYGKPVMSFGSVGIKSSKVRFDRILQVALGSLMSIWRSSDSDLETVSRFLVIFGNTLEASLSATEQLRWPKLLSQQASSYLASDEHGRNDVSRFVSLGRRRYGVFLAAKQAHPAPCFGLSDPGFFIKVLQPERKIAALRDIATSLGSALDLAGAIIRIIHQMNLETGFLMVEYASVLPQLVGPELQRKAHRRWIIFPHPCARGCQGDCEADTKACPCRENEFQVIERSIEIMRVFGEPCGFLDANTFNPHPTLVVGEYTWSDDGLVDFNWTKRGPPRSLDYLIQQSSWADVKFPAQRRLAGWQLGHLDQAYEDVGYRFLFGRRRDAGVYLPTSNWREVTVSLPVDYVTNALGSGYMDTGILSSHFRNVSTRTSPSAEVIISALWSLWPARKRSLQNYRTRKLTWLHVPRHFVRQTGPLPRFMATMKDGVGRYPWHASLYFIQDSMI